MYSVPPPTALLWKKPLQGSARFKRVGFLCYGQEDLQISSVKSERWSCAYETMLQILLFQQSRFDIGQAWLLFLTEAVNIALQRIPRSSKLDPLVEIMVSY